MDNSPDAGILQNSTATPAQRRDRDLRGVRLFTVVTFLYSWPMFFVLDAWLVPKLFGRGDVAAGWLTALFGHMAAMLGPGLAAMLLWRRYHRQSFPAWRWSRPAHYARAAAAMLALWAVPGVIGLVLSDTLHLRNPMETFAWVVVGTSLSLGWLAGVGEELGWTAYLLPRLAPHIGKSRALVVAGAIRGLWHWPVLVGPHIARTLSGGEHWGTLVLMSIVLAVQLVVSNALFGALFGWVWYKTESVALLGWCHQWFDAARDITVLVVVGYAGTVWFTMLWGTPFYLFAGVVLMRVAGEEGADMWTLARRRP